MKYGNVKVRDLKAGDVLMGGAKVLTAPTYIPILRKCTLMVQYPSASPKQVTWGADTTVSRNSGTLEEALFRVGQLPDYISGAEIRARIKRVYMEYGLTPDAAMIEAAFRKYDAS